jgi:hypothetical protein
VRFGVAAAPVAAAVGCSSLISRALPTPSSDAGLLTWWVTDRFARRLLPLSLLLKLSLPFPDAPPSRIRIAIRSGSPKQLEKWAASVAARGRKDPKAVAAHELLGLVAALSAHDRRSRGHSERVRVYTDLMAEQLGLSRDDADKLRWASLLHDIGKIRVPAAILNKPGAPDDDEWQVIRQHPSDGDRLIEPVRKWLGPWSTAVIEHHERWDGKGYPRGLAGHNISLAGRVVAVTDSYEVMTATRSYKKPMPAKAARAELTRCAGTHFDPAMVRAFLSVPIGHVRWTAGPVAWLAQLPFLAQIPTWGATAMMATTVVAATPFVTSVAALNAAPAPLEAVTEEVDTAAQTGGDPAALRITTTTTTTDGSATSNGGNGADASPQGPDKEPPGRAKPTTTTTTVTTSTTAPVDVTTTTKPGNGKGRGNGNAGN